MVGESGSTCRISLWYWIEGADVGSLRVLLQNKEDQTQELYIFDGNSGYDWKQVM